MTDAAALELLDDFKDILLDEKGPPLDPRRCNYLTASEIPIILGMSTEAQSSAIFKKINNVDSTPPNDAMRYGIDREVKIRKDIRAQDNFLSDLSTMGFCPSKNPRSYFISCTPDGLAYDKQVGGYVLIEMKARYLYWKNTGIGWLNPKKTIEMTQWAKQYLDDHTNNFDTAIPTKWKMQVQLQMECCNMENCVLAVLMENQMDQKDYYVYYNIKRNEEAIKCLLEPALTIYDFIRFQRKEQPEDRLTVAGIRRWLKDNNLYVPYRK